MTKADLDPRVRRLLEDALEKHDLEMSVAEKLLTLAKRYEGDELEENVRSLLRGA